MKRILTIATALFMLGACANDRVTGEEGAVNDGIKAVDTNGALNDNGGPLTDSTNNPIENKTRTDIQQRDTFTNPGQ